MKLTNKKVIVGVLSAAMLSGTILPSVSSAATPSTTSHVESNQLVASVKNFNPSHESIEFMSKVVKSGAIKEFSYSSDYKTMSYKHDMNTIKATYNFSDEDISKLDQIATFYNESQKNGAATAMNFTNQSMNQIAKDGGPNYVGVDYGWTWIKMTFTNEEMKLFLVEAAIAGPYALYGAFVGLSALTSTPVGGAIVGALGLIGMPKFASICQTIIRAWHADKGVSIEIGLDGVIPYISAAVARH